MSTFPLLAAVDWNLTIDPILRTLHIMAGITWIGLLYFFNFVNVPLQGALDGEVKKAVNPELMPRALWWFRWAAMWTLILGVLLFGWVYYHQGYFFEADTHKPSGRAMWAMLGMVLGIKMWANVWFVIWPAQRKILAAAAAGEAAPAKLAAKAKRFSWLNTMLSGPMLFTMVAGPHFSTMAWQFLVITIVVGLAIPWVMFKISAGVAASK